MRILLISHNIVRGDGQGRVNLELARDCLAHGHDLTLIADRVDSALLDDGAQWVPIHPALDRPNLLKAPLFAIQANRLVRRMRANFDLIVGNGYVLTERHHVNISHFVHGAQQRDATRRSSGSTARALYHAIYRRFNARQEKRSYGAAAAVVAISDAVRKELVSIGIPDGRIRVIHNGVDTDEFRPGPADPSALGLPIDGPKALFVGDIRSDRKNLGTVLRALRLVGEMRLIVVGKMEGSPYPEMARELGVDERVTFLGYRSDVAAVMRACDLFVFPTRYEPFGLVVLEALSSGLPVIVSRDAGAAEVMTDGCGAILDDPLDGHALASAMRQLADDRLRKSMAPLARARACGHDWRQMGTQYLRLFQELESRAGKFCATADTLH